LSAGADQVEQKLLARILCAAPKARSELGELEKQLESVVTKRLAAATQESNRGLTDAQLEVARELLNWGLPTGERIGIAREQTGKAKQHGRLDPKLGGAIGPLARVRGHSPDIRRTRPRLLSSLRQQADSCRSPLLSTDWRQVEVPCFVDSLLMALSGSSARQAQSRCSTVGHSRQKA
jgi:hypothetical protein